MSVPSVLHCSTLADLEWSSLYTHYLAASKEPLLEFFVSTHFHLCLS